MTTHIADINTKNGTSSHIPTGILYEADIGVLAVAYISGYNPGTWGKYSWAGSSAFGLNGQTFEFSAAEFIAKLQKPVALVRERNQKAIALIEKWFSEPDDLGPAFWEKFDKELESNKFTI